MRETGKVLKIIERQKNFFDCGHVLFAAAAVLGGERQEVGTRDKPSRYQS